MAVQESVGSLESMLSKELLVLSSDREQPCFLYRAIVVGMLVKRVAWETYSKRASHDLSLSNIVFVTVMLNNSNNLGKWKARNLSHILNDYCCHHNPPHKCSYKHWWKCVE